MFLGPFVLVKCFVQLCLTFACKIKKRTPTAAVLGLRSQGMYCLKQAFSRLPFKTSRKTLFFYIVVSSPPQFFQPSAAIAKPQAPPPPYPLVPQHPAQPVASKRLTPTKNRPLALVHKEGGRRRPEFLLAKTRGSRTHLPLWELLNNNNANFELKFLPSWTICKGLSAGLAISLTVEPTALLYGRLEPARKARRFFSPPSAKTSTLAKIQLLKNQPKPGQPGNLFIS